MKRISTKIFVAKGAFNSQAKFGNWIRMVDPSHGRKNADMRDLILRAEGIPAELLKKNVIPTLESVANYLVNGSTNGSNNDFVAYAEKLKQQFFETQQVNTWKKYQTSITKLKKFIGSNELKFSDINVALLGEYERHLKINGNATNTIKKELNIVRAILYRAIKEDLFSQEKNPFFKFSVKGAKTNKVKLTADEIKLIELLDLPERTVLWHTRNYFIFAFYCAGIRFNDFVQLKWKNIQDGRLVYQMNKTSDHKSIKLFPQALRILGFYEESKMHEGDFIFPVLDKKYKYTDKFFLYNKISSKNTIVNLNLKKLAALAKISKNVSFHISRHTFADVARKMNMPIYDISKALGHSSIKITESYISSLDQDSVDITMGKMFEE